MAHRLLGRGVAEVRESPAAQQWVAQVIQSCLTTPFDTAALRCLNQSRNLTRCLDDLVQRSPETRGQAVFLVEKLTHH